MTRLSRAAAVAVAALAAWAAVGGVPGGDAPVEARFVSLLAWQLVGTGALVAAFNVLSRSALAVALGVVLHVALSAVPAVAVLPVGRLPEFLLMQAAFAALVASGWWLEAAAGARCPGGVGALLLGSAATLAPFGLDAWLETSPSMGAAAAGIERVISLSPPVASCESALGWDLFKHEPVYRIHRVGETVFRWPPPREAAITILALAGAVLAAAAVIRALRAGIRRMARTSAATL